MNRFLASTPVVIDIVVAAQVTYALTFADTPIAPPKCYASDGGMQ